MAAGDASSAEMRRLHHDRDAGPLALDDDTVERLLAGTLSPAQAPAGYAKVAQLLRAAAAAPTPEELAGQGAVLAELRAAAQARPTAAMAAGRPPRRRRRTGLAVVVVVGALVTGGVAGAATGHLPGPVRDAARTITGAGGGAPSSPTTADQPPITGAAGAGPEGSRHAGTLGQGSGATGNGAGPAPVAALKGLCNAYAAGNGAAQGGKLDATAFKALATAAGGEDKVATFCEDLLPGDQKLKEPKEPKDAKQPKEPEKPEQPDPSGTGGQGQGGHTPERARTP
jgi:hypothetical protein